MKSIDEFYKKPDGRPRYECKDCYKQDAKNYRKSHSIQVIINKEKYTDYDYFINKTGKYSFLRYVKSGSYKYDGGELLKQCPICKNYFPMREYRSDHQGTKHYCKKCQNLPIEERRKYIKQTKRQSNFDPFKLIDNERFELNLKSILAFVSYLKKSQQEEV